MIFRIAIISSLNWRDLIETYDCSFYLKIYLNRWYKKFANQIQTLFKIHIKKNYKNRLNDNF